MEMEIEGAYYRESAVELIENNIEDHHTENYDSNVHVVVRLVFSLFSSQ